jgi:hypothetical protein
MPIIIPTSNIVIKLLYALVHEGLRFARSEEILPMFDHGSSMFLGKISLAFQIRPKTSHPCVVAWH